jgi:lipopolysaccharide export system protein LptA
VISLFILLQEKALGQLKNNKKIFLNFLLVGFALLILTPGLFAQRKSKVFVERTKIQRYTAALAKERLIGDVILRQENTRFYCDSAYLSGEGNSYEAFGNVHINVNDSIDVYGDRLFYDGNTKIAELFDNVKLVDDETVLTTEHLVYNRNTRIAYYDTEGTIVNHENTLTSKTGFYNTDSKIFYFQKDVVLINPDSETYSDTLIYNTVSETAYFHGPTIIRGKESTIYTEEGWYNTQTDFSKLTDRPTISSAEQTITADSILYNNNTSFGKAFGLVEVIDTTHQVIIRGKYGEMWDSKGKSFITDHALAITYDDHDSLFIHADTMWMNFDKNREAKSMLAYYNVRFFRKDMQGKCDSMAYRMADSTIRLYTDPVIWSGKNQLTADSINLAVVNNQVDSLIMYNTAFIVSRDSTDTYNQIRGKNMIGYFYKNELVRIKVDGNAQTIYFIREDDGFLMGINLAESSSMIIRLENNDVKTINYQTEAEEIMYPEPELPNEMKRLKGFNWQEKFRPRNKNEIFEPAPSKEQFSIDK